MKSKSMKKIIFIFTTSLGFQFFDLMYATRSRARFVPPKDTIDFGRGLDFPNNAIAIGQCTSHKISNRIFTTHHQQLINHVRKRKRRPRREEVDQLICQGRASVPRRSCRTLPSSRQVRHPYGSRCPRLPRCRSRVPLRRDLGACR